MFIMNFLLQASIEEFLHTSLKAFSTRSSDYLKQETKDQLITTISLLRSYVSDSYNLTKEAPKFVGAIFSFFICNECGRSCFHLIFAWIFRKFVSYLFKESAKFSSEDGFA